jgi:hypothetical protein
MGDNGKLYIPEDEVPEYKGLLREADLILPNQFEAEYVTKCTVGNMGWRLTTPQTTFRHSNHRSQVSRCRDTSASQDVPSTSCHHHLAPSDT